MMVYTWAGSQEDWADRLPSLPITHECTPLTTCKPSKKTAIPPWVFTHSFLELVLDPATLASIYLSTSYLSVCLSIYQLIYLSIFIYLSICLFIFLRICLPTNLLLINQPTYPLPMMPLVVKKKEFKFSMQKKKKKKTQKKTCPSSFRTQVF